MSNPIPKLKRTKLLISQHLPQTPSRLSKWHPNFSELLRPWVTNNPSNNIIRPSLKEYQNLTCYHLHYADPGPRNHHFHLDYCSSLFIFSLHPTLATSFHSKQSSQGDIVKMYVMYLLLYPKSPIFSQSTPSKSPNHYSGLLGTGLSVPPTPCHYHFFFKVPWFLTCV